MERTNGNTSLNSSFGICRICLDQVVTDIEATRCGHIYHGECINKWLKNSSMCPACRSNVHPTELIKLFPAVDKKDIMPTAEDDYSQSVLKLMDTIEKAEVADIIFKDAISDPIHCEKYVDLCLVISTKTFSGQDNTVSLFKNALLNRCQKEFFKENTDEIKILKDIHELKNRSIVSNDLNAVENLIVGRDKLKRKRLGCIAFVGVLYMKDILSLKVILRQCIGTLIYRIQYMRILDKIEAEVVIDIESLAELYSVVGLKLDKESRKEEENRKLFKEMFNTFKGFAAG